jgi:hypothetical protein
MCLNAAAGADVTFTAKPTATRVGDQVKIAFAVSAPTDVEVLLLDQAGRVVRHLAGGVLGGANPPPAPLKPGLAQDLAWNGKDDFGKPAPAGPAKVLVRAGLGVKFGRFIGADPYNFGRVAGSAVDEDGNVYVLGYAGQLNQGHMCLRVFDKDGRYLREILPFPANLPKDAVKDLARWDEDAQTFRLGNRRNLNPDFYGQSKPGSAMTLVSASTKDGVVLQDRGRTLVIDATTGAVRLASGTPPAATSRPERSAAFDIVRSRLTFKGDDKSALPTDWNRLTVDYGRDEVYVSDGARCLWRFSGLTGEGGLLRKDNKAFWAADVAVGYDGLLYLRKCRGYTPGVTDFSGPLERYTRDLAPAPYPSGTHVISPYIYGRYGIGYADRGIGVGPDGSVYTSFMYKWVKYCTAGFGPDGQALKGKYLEGQVGGKGPSRDWGDYPPELTSAIIGPITGANGGVRVDLQGNLYLGLWLLPKAYVPPKGYEKDNGYKYSVGSVVRFTPAGGFMAVTREWLGADPIDIVPRTPGAPGLEVVNTIFGASFVEGATAIYQGLAPFSHSPYPDNTCCVCRAPRFDVDRFGRILMPNAITNSVVLYDNAGNVVLEFGKYGNFDSQYVPADAGAVKVAVAVPDIPLTWPTAAGASEDHFYVNDTYSRRVVRVDKTYRAQESCDLK